MRLLAVPFEASLLACSPSPPPRDLARAPRDQPRPHEGGTTPRDRDRGRERRDQLVTEPAI
eukprot:3142480-Rhodomonas_salina.1